MSNSKEREDTSLRLFIMSKGLTTKDFFEKINHIWRPGKKIPDSASQSTIINKGRIPYEKRFWRAVQKTFNLSEKEIGDLRSNEQIDYLSRVVSTPLSMVVTEENMTVLSEIRGVAKERFTLDFAIKTLTELVKQNPSP